jgi:hypothetical protein
MIHIKYLIVYDACHHPYYFYSIHSIAKSYKTLLKHPYYYNSIYWLVNVKYLRKDMVLQKKSCLFCLDLLKMKLYHVKFKKNSKNS